MRILIRHGDRQYRFLNIDSSTRDGSLSITVRRNGKSHQMYQWGSRPGEENPIRIELTPERARTKEITVHQSGRVNFHEIGRSIYVEPLTLISKPAWIYRYRIPKISRLTAFDAESDPEDFEFDMSDLGDEPHSFTLFVGPESMAPDARAIKLAYLKRYAFVIALDPQALVPPPELSEHFVTLKPEAGTIGAQGMPEDQALISYHQVLHDAKGLIVYGPNGEGVWQVVFAVPMRDAPQVSIELSDPALYVDEGDIVRDVRAATAMLRFKIRNRNTNAIIKTPVAFHSIELNARLT